MYSFDEDENTIFIASKIAKGKKYFKGV